MVPMTVEALIALLQARALNFLHKEFKEYNYTVFVSN